MLDKIHNDTCITNDVSGSLGRFHCDGILRQEVALLKAVLIVLTVIFLQEHGESTHTDLTGFETLTIVHLFLIY